MIEVVRCMAARCQWVSRACIPVIRVFVQANTGRKVQSGFRETPSISQFEQSNSSGEIGKALISCIRGGALRRRRSNLDKPDLGPGQRIPPPIHRRDGPPLGA